MILIVIVMIVYLIFLFMKEEDMNKPKDNEYTAIQWAQQAGIIGSKAASSIATSLGYYKVKGLIYRIERDNNIYWGLCGVSKQEVINRMREVALHHIEQGMKDIEVVEN